MKRYFNIFLLHFQQVFERRGMALIWVLMAVINPLFVLAFWFGVYKGTGGSISDWSLSSVTAYYFLLIIAGSFLIVHIEYDVAERDIQQGGLVKYLLRPFSYFWHYFFMELGWRAFQGLVSILVFLLFYLLLGNFVHISLTLLQVFLAVIIIVLGYFISFVFKMILGLSAFWLTDFQGLQNIVEIAILVFAGFVMPLEFYPKVLQQISHVLPFAYMVYYPVVAIAGRLALQESFFIIGIQLLWVFSLVIVYKIMWKKGIHSFIGIGQ